MAPACRAAPAGAVAPAASGGAGSARRAGGDRLVPCGGGCGQRAGDKWGSLTGPNTDFPDAAAFSAATESGPGREFLADAPNYAAGGAVMLHFDTEGS